ncbi:MAG: ATP-binding protein [Spirochaetaceae bacterium]|jgi:predicted AAA+ superfamily ATPase|nr:ATP-binding protein [Spirochaetaceae bacterium]
MNITENIYAILADIVGLSIFSGVREHPLLFSFKNLLEDITSDKFDESAFDITDTSLEIIRDWACFSEVFVQYQQAYSFYLTMVYLTLTDDNPYTRAAETPAVPPPVLCAMAKTDLSRLGRIASFPIHNLGFHIAETLRKSGLEQLAQNIEEESRVLWAAEGRKAQTEGAETALRIFPENTSWGTSLPALTEHIRTRGAGLPGLYTVFRWMPEDPLPVSTPSSLMSFTIPSPKSLISQALIPVRSPDPIRLADLYGYEDQRSVVVANTLRFLDGKPANNLLLYGDRGTGKSVTVKAVCNEYADRGLRLLEIRKSDLNQFPFIMEALAPRFCRFIIFIDDLSFETVDDSFRELKTLLEGEVEAKSPNVVIYATSNRRHLVREGSADQPIGGIPGAGVEARAFDTVQEQLSLADRFGLTVIYNTPSQEEYLRIAECIARRRGLLPAEEGGCTGEDPDKGPITEKRKAFRENALRWERWFNGRSPRTAVQYVDWVTGGDGFPWE